MKTFYENICYIQQQLSLLVGVGVRFGYVERLRWLAARLGQCVADAKENNRLQADVEEEYLGYVEAIEEYDIEDENEGYTYSDYGCDAPQDSIDEWADRMRSERRERSDMDV